jgi:hypothetical protein
MFSEQDITTYQTITERLLKNDDEYEDFFIYLPPYSKQMHPREVEAYPVYSTSSLLLSLI